MLFCVCLFFFKQKTAYEMRISDWSSDVCSSDLLQVLPQFDWATTLLAIVSLVLVIFTSRIPRMSRVPGPLCALVVVTAVQALFNFESVATIGSTFGEIPRGLPTFQWPDITLTRLVELIGPAFAIAMLGAIESLLSAVVAEIGRAHV